MNLLQAILCGGIYWFYAVYFGYPLWGICAQPLVTCTIVGAIMGDVATGALCGAAIAPLYIALSGAGGVVTADKSASSIIPTAMVIAGNLDIAAGIALAVPVSLLFSQIHNVLKLVNTYIVHRCDAAAEKGNDKAISFNAVILVNLVKILLYWVPMAVILYVGAMSVDGLAEQIPAWLSNGLSVVSTLMPALGIGMTMVVIGRTDLLPFFVAGFFLAAYTEIANMPLLILGLVLAYLYVVFTKEKNADDGAVFNTTQAQEPQKRLLTKRDVVRTYNRWWSTVDMSLSFERLQGMSFCFSMIPNLRKLYKDDPEEFKAALKRHLQFFNTEGAWGAAIHGIVTRSTSDVTNIQMFLSLLLRLGVTAPLMAVAGLVLSSLTGGELSSVLSLAIPALIIGVGVILIFVSRYSVTLRQRIDRLNKIFLETLEGVRVIRAFNRQGKEMERFSQANGELASMTILSGRVTALLMPVIQVIFGVTTAAVMGMGSWYVSAGEMAVGDLVANSQYISMILAAIMMLALVIMLFPVSYACAKRIAEVLNTESSIKDGRYSAALRKGRACVAFDHVTFTYPGADEPVLKDVSFECRAGEVTAIIGRTGCGKSSILKLIPRLYDATVGHVYVDDMNVKQYKLNELRDLIGYIPQKNVLFSGDVASNLRFGDQDSSEEQWRQAAYIACADEFIEQKPDGYHAEIAQGGTNLSGGQRQRMAIARAVVKKPEIYLFDDSFSALDVKTDKTLRMRLRESMGDSTMLIVAQRVGSILDADRILVMEDGQIVGRGKHRELLHTCPLYREIAELQLGEEEVKHELECV